MILNVATTDCSKNSDGNLMSFTKYLETKSRPRMSILIDAYKEKLQADLAGLVMKPDGQLTEAKKNIVNIHEISKILSELKYPLVNEFNMAVRTGNSKRVHHAHMTFRKWVEYSKPNKKLSDKVETVMFQYQASLFNNEFGPNQVDEVIKSSLAESQAIMENFEKQIDLAISSLNQWGNHVVTLEAISPESGWVISEIKVILGDSFKAEFTLTNTPLGLKVGDLKKEEIPASLEDDALMLMKKLNNIPKYNKILTLYMTRPVTDRRYFEMTKRDLSLGIQTGLPNHVVLATSPLSEEQDVWKVKIEEKYLREHLCEGDYKEYYIIGDDAPIKWIEQYRKVDDEK